MAAGTQPYIIDQEYDPRTITLNEFISLYEKESVETGGRKNKTWGNLIRNNKITKQYLDQPVVTLFGPVPSEAQSVMTDIQNAAGGQAATIQSKFRVIEENIFPKLSTLGKKEGVDLVTGYSRISEEVKKIQTRGGKFTAEKGFNVNKVGELVENLKTHVEEFPEDKPIANAILFNIDNGSRPSLTTEIRTVHYMPNQLGETGAAMGFTGRDGLLIPAGTKGVKRQAKGQAPNIQPYNAPLSKRGITILQDQSDYNSKIIGDNKKLDFYFQVLDKKGEPRPITLTDINRVLEKTSPFGLLFEYTEEGPKPVKTPITSKNLRNLFINSADLVIEKGNISMLTNRDTAVNTGSQEIYMGSPGQYKPKAIQDLDRVSMTNWGFYTLRDEKNRKVYEETGEMLNPNQFVFGTNEIDPETKKFTPDNVSYASFMGAEPKNIPIQTTGFSPKLEEKITEEIVDDSTSPKLKMGENDIIDTTQDVNSFADFTEEELDELEAGGITSAKEEAKNLKTSTTKKVLGTAATAVGIGISKVGKTLPIVGGAFEYEEAIRQGDDPEIAKAKGLMGTVSPISPSDITAAEEVVGFAAEPLVEQAKKSMQEQDVGFLEGLTRGLTGVPMGGFSSGGFINKN